MLMGKERSKTTNAGTSFSMEDLSEGGYSSSLTTAPS